MLATVQIEKDIYATLGNPKQKRNQIRGNKIELRLLASKLVQNLNWQFREFDANKNKTIKKIRQFQAVYCRR